MKKDEEKKQVKEDLDGIEDSTGDEEHSKQ